MSLRREVGDGKEKEAERCGDGFGRVINGCEISFDQWLFKESLRSFSSSKA